jgi:hypothetical protein
VLVPQPQPLALPHVLVKDFTLPELHVLLVPPVQPLLALVHVLLKVGSQLDLPVMHVMDQPPHVPQLMCLPHVNGEPIQLHSLEVM